MQQKLVSAILSGNNLTKENIIKNKKPLFIHPSKILERIGLSFEGIDDQQEDY